MSVRTLFAWIVFFLLLVPTVLAHEPVVGNVVNPPFPVTVQAINASSTIRPCEVASFAFTLTNPTSFEETLDLGAEPLFDGVFFSTNPVVLAPGRSADVNLFLVPPCEVYGTFNVELLARLRSDGHQAKTLIGSLEVLSDGIVEIAKGAKKIRVDYNRSGTSIPLTNIGKVDDAYDLSVDGPSWVSIKPVAAAVPAGETATVQIVTAPPTSVEQGTYRMTVFAKSRATGAEYGKSLQIALAPFTAEELQWEALKPILTAVGIGLLILFLLFLIVLLYLLKTRDARRAAREARNAAREEARLAKAARKEARFTERLEGIKAMWAARIKDWFKKQLEKEYVLIRPDGSIVRRWPKRLLWSFIVLVIGAVVGFAAFTFWALIAPFAVAIGLILAAILLIIGIACSIRAFQFYRAKSRFTSDELDELRKQALDELRSEYSLVPRDSLKDAMSRRGWLCVAFYLVLSLVCLGVALAAWFFASIFAGFWLGVFVAGLVLAFVFALLAYVCYQRSKQRFAYQLIPSVKAGQTVGMKTGWKDGVTELGLKSKVDKDGVLLSAERLDESPSFVAPDGSSYQFVDVRAPPMVEKEVDSLTVKFKVKKSWLKKHKCQDSDVMLMRYDAGKARWVKADECQVVDVDSTFVYYSAKVSGPGQLAIVAKPKKGAVDDESSAPGFFARWFGSKDADDSRSIEDEIAARKAARDAAKREQERLLAEQRRQAELDALLAAQEGKKRRWVRWLGWLLLLLFLIAFIVGVVWFLNPALMPAGLAQWLGVNQNPPPIAPPPSTGPVGTPEIRVGIPDQVWRENTVHTMDLSRWFSDPDGDVLAFSHTPMSNILIEYNGSIATLTPARDFVGEAQTVFTATDKGGASARSNDVRLIVQAGPKSGAEQAFDDAASFVKEYIGYIVAGLIALAVIVVSIVMLRRAEKEDEE